MNFKTTTDVILNLKKNELNLITRKNVYIFPNLQVMLVKSIIVFY